MIYLINTKTKEHIDAVALGDAEYERLAGSSGWIFQMADTDGWIEWQGGKCPLPDDARCDVIHRSGFSSLNRPADGWAWGRDYEGDDIIAYRPIIDASAEPEPPAWDVGCLPPVGCECEVNGTPLHDGQDGWKRCEIIAHTDFGHGPIAVARVCDDTQCAWGTAGSFRPIRSEEDRAVEEMERAYRTDPSSPSVTHGMRHLYRAIRDSKIPGVTLEVDP